MDYYSRCSSAQFLANIRVNTLLVQAKDDPFLSPSCYPRETAAASGFLHLEIPRYGGHVGFVQQNSANLYWSEERAGLFLEEILAGQGCVTTAADARRRWTGQWS